jgi:hypothetical protein
MLKGGIKQDENFCYDVQRLWSNGDVAPPETYWISNIRITTDGTLILYDGMSYPKRIFAAGTWHTARLRSIK